MPGIDAQTVLMLHNDDTSLSDSSNYAHTVTLNGTIARSSAASMFGGFSAFSAAIGYLSLDGSADFTVGTSDWTIDFWVRPAATGISQFLYDGRPSGTNGAYIGGFYIGSDDKIHYFANSSERIVSTASVSINTWVHIALARAGTSTKLFMGGTQEGSTFTDSINYLGPGAGRPFIGAASDGSAALNGYIDEFRFSKGVARWTGNFTPPTSAYSIDSSRLSQKMLMGIG